MLRALLEQPFTTALLGAVLRHDLDTHRHLLHVGALAAQVAQAVGMRRDDAIVLGQAGLFHDVGKIHVAQRLLRSAAVLDDRDWDAIRAHAELGAAMLRAAGAPRIASIVRGHHERLDGSGYPDGLRGLQIPWETRLLSVVDAYDAMRAGRPYAAPIGHDDALERLTTARALYDADAVAALVAVVEEAPAAVS